MRIHPNHRWCDSITETIRRIVSNLLCNLRQHLRRHFVDHYRHSLVHYRCFCGGTPVCVLCCLLSVKCSRAQGILKYILIIDNLFHVIQRLDAILRSSLYSHFSESLSGLATIRAYGEAKRFRSDNERFIDVENRAYWLTVVNQVCFFFFENACS